MIAPAVGEYNWVLPDAPQSKSFVRVDTTVIVDDTSVRQKTIKKTICRSGWTAKIRPPVSYTKRAQAPADGAVRGDGLTLGLGGGSSDPA